MIHTTPGGQWGSAGGLLRLPHGSLCGQRAEGDTRLPRISGEQSAEAESGGGLPPTCSLLLRVPPSPSDPLWGPPPTNNPQENPGGAVPFLSSYNSEA